MNRLLPAAAVIAVAFAAAPALAQSQTQQGQTGQMPAPRAESQTTTSFTDTQLQSYAAAKAEIDRLGQSASESQRSAVLQRHNIDARTYASIDRAARQDRELQQRIASLPPHTRSE